MRVHIRLNSCPTNTPVSLEVGRILRPTVEKERREIERREKRKEKREMIHER